MSRSLHSSLYKEMPIKGTAIYCIHASIAYCIKVYAVCLLLKASPALDRRYYENTHTPKKSILYCKAVFRQTRQGRDEARKEKYRTDLLKPTQTKPLSDTAVTPLFSLTLLVLLTMSTAAYKTRSLQ